MSNIMINEVCNLQCPYCFANEYVNNDTSKDMTFSNFKKAVDWLVGSNTNRIGIIGGEPTLHPMFADFLRYVNGVKKKDQNILIFSNGLKIDKHIDVIAKTNAHILLNINSPQNIGAKNFNKTKENIALLRLKNISVSIGINLYDANMDFDFIKEIISKYNYHILRVGITCPNTKELKNSSSSKYFKTIKPALMRLVRECKEVDCAVSLDCQKIPICYFTSTELDELAQVKSEFPDTQILKEFACTPVIDILPNLKCVRCFGTSCTQLEIPMELFRTEDDMKSYYETNFDNVAKHITKEVKCNGCIESRTGKCQQGCLAFKLPETMNLISIIEESKRL